jgi:hypothetical protein
MWMFWAFKLSFGVDILAFFGHFFQKLGKILFSYMVTLLECTSLVANIKLDVYEIVSRTNTLAYSVPKTEK